MGDMRVVFFLIYAVSGAAALIYEVAWTRMLTLHMGHTVAAASTVLAAFMGGMALGAVFGGRAAARRTRDHALRLYAALEVAIAVCAILLPLALAAMRPLLAWAYGDGQREALFGLTRFATSLLLLGVPSAAMGATFPIASRWVVGRIDQAGHDVGNVYAANTIGAAAGAAGASFLLIPSFGLRGTTWFAVCFNIAAAAGALWIGVRTRRREDNDANVEIGVPRGAMVAVATKTSGGRKTRARSPQEPGTAEGQPALAALALTVSGFVALVYEVAWTRILAMVVGPTTYAFGAMLIAFITGLALGSVIGTRLTARVRQPVLWLGGTLIAGALAAFGVVSIVGRLPLFLARNVVGADAQFGSVVGFASLIVIALLLPMTAALGAAFPLGVRLAVRRIETVSIDIAMVYTANTLGAIAGAIAGGFALVPLLGLQTTVRTAGLLAIAGGIFVIVFGSAKGRGRVVGLAWGALAVAAALVFPRWDNKLMSSGAYKYARYIRGTDLESRLKAGTLLYYKEGAVATVSVKRVVGAVSLAIDGKVDASNAGDMLTQKLLAHLPLLLHPNPKQVGIIGLGSGVTLGAALRHPIARADMLEISPEVVEASSYFARENHHALDDRRARLILGDGRSHLILAAARYDVIISEPSNPWMAGVAALFTREFFAAARSRLTPGGILCQWTHTYDISEPDLKSIVATFRSVFPHASMWLVGTGDLLLVGSDQSLNDRIAQMARHFERPGVAADLAEVAVTDPFCLLSLFAGSERALERYAGNAVIQTDDRLALEFSAPKSVFGHSQLENAVALQRLAEEAERPAAVAEAFSSATGAQWRSRGEMESGAQAFALAYDAFAHALSLAPDDEAAPRGLSRASGGSGRQQNAIALLTELVDRRPASIAARVELSRLLASKGDFDRAIEIARQGIAFEEDDPRCAEQLAAVLSDAGDIERLRPLVEYLQEKWPERPGSLYYAAAVEFLQGARAKAVALAERAVQAAPADAKGRNLLGAVYASLGKSDEARQAFQDALRFDPHDATPYVNLGLLDLESAIPGSAANYFAEALIVDPGSPGALKGLSVSLERLNERDRAARILTTGAAR